MRSGELPAAKWLYICALSPSLDISSGVEATWLAHDSRRIPERNCILKRNCRGFCCGKTFSVGSFIFSFAVTRAAPVPTPGFLLVFQGQGSLRFESYSLSSSEPVVPPQERQAMVNVMQDALIQEHRLVRCPHTPMFWPPCGSCILCGSV